MRLDVDAATDALARLGRELQLSPVETARGIVAVVNANMVGAVRLVTVQRGIDPSGLALLAFGGAGPLHASALARELGIRSTVVPPGPGLLCALGLLAEDLRIDAVRTCVDPARARGAAAAREALRRDGGGGGGVARARARAGGAAIPRALARPPLRRPELRIARGRARRGLDGTAPRCPPRSLPRHPRGGVRLRRRRRADPGGERAAGGPRPARSAHPSEASPRGRPTSAAPPPAAARCSSKASRASSSARSTTAGASAPATRSPVQPSSSSSTAPP